MESNRRTGLVLAFATIAWLAVSAYLLLEPSLGSDPRISGASRSAVAHGAISAVLVVLVIELTLTIKASRRVRAVALPLAICASLLGAELIQLAVPRRLVDSGDLRANLIGGLVGVAVYLAIRAAVRSDESRRWLLSYMIIFLAIVTIAGERLTRPEPEALASEASSAEANADATTDEEDRCGPATGVQTTAPTDAAPIAAYAFESDPLGGVRDSAGTLDLAVVDAEGLTWSPGAIDVDGASIRSDVSPNPITQRLRHAGELTLVVGFESSDPTQGGPARLVTISDGVTKTDVNVHLGLDNGLVSVRLRNSCQTSHWLQFLPEEPIADGEAHVLAATYAGGLVRVFLDGNEIGRADVGDGTFENWDDSFPLVLSNEATRDRPFVGTIFAVEIYDVALENPRL